MFSTAAKKTIRLEGTVESAQACRQALLAARDLMPEGEDRDWIVAMAIQLRYELKAKGQKVKFRLPE